MARVNSRNYVERKVPTVKNSRCKAPWRDWWLGKYHSPITLKVNIPTRLHGKRLRLKVEVIE